ncbi:MAG: mechanosensitive ion channel [Bacteroidales bacterium]|nr:mechanosensitive ion channel [Bacteroidales bacterium]MBO5854869.1 mechanosensitive ion channel [Bacteroidales bacterium]
MFEKYITLLNNLFHKIGLSENLSSFIAEIISFISLILLAFIAYYIVHLAVKKVIYVFIEKSQSERDDILIKNKVFKRLCLIVPAYIIRNFITTALPSYPTLAATIIVVTKIYEVFIYSRVLDAILTTLNEIYDTYEISKSKPIKGFIQVLKTIIYIICLLLVIAILTQKQLSNILIGLGTLSAVLMLVFKDPILGFVGGIQLTINDMLRIGDWIVMEKSKADGEVLEIGLTTVKVQNWDKTITTIPTYSLISDSFTNWRGMENSGGRRIARSFVIDIDTIKFCTPEMLERFKKFQLVSQYIIDKEKEIEEYNKSNNIDDSNLVNGRRQTNIGIFRAYLNAYLANCPYINKDMTFMVRQLSPTENGVPIQIYAFSSNKAWISYENIQSDIFDHVFAVVTMFDLKIYQKPSSNSLMSSIGVME